jgi:hypothetical protein
VVVAVVVVVAVPLRLEVVVAVPLLRSLRRRKKERTPCILSGE